MRDSGTVSSCIALKIAASMESCICLSSSERLLRMSCASLRMMSTSVCTCSLVGIALGLGTALGAGGGPIGFVGGAAEARRPGSAFDHGVSGARVVARDDAIDDGRPGRSIGKSAASKNGGTAGRRGTTSQIFQKGLSEQKDVLIRSDTF